MYNLGDILYNHHSWKLDKKILINPFISLNSWLDHMEYLWISRNGVSEINQSINQSKTLFKHGKIYSNLQIFIKLQLEQSTDELQST